MLSTQQNHSFVDYSGNFIILILLTSNIKILLLWTSRNAIDQFEWFLGPIVHCLSARFCGLTLYSPHTASTFAAVKLGCSHDVNVSIGAKDWWHPTTRHNSDFSSLHVVNTQNSFVYQWEGVTSIIFRNFHNTNKASKQDFSHVTRKYIAHTKNWPNKVKYLIFRQLQIFTISLQIAFAKWDYSEKCKIQQNM